MSELKLGYYEDLAVGEVQHFNKGYTVTEAEVIEVGTRWDPQPFHVDREAAKESMFGGLVASSVHVFAMWVALGMEDPDKRSAAISALGFNHMKMRQPIRPGDVLRSVATLKEKRLSNSHPHCGIVTMANEMFNQHDLLVFSIEHSYLIKCRDYDQAQGIS
tara:strand:+ start:1721 stop:2203 length:483 start_codon:yes stop_codon:yes gene_type:complete